MFTWEMAACIRCIQEEKKKGTKRGSDGIQEASNKVIKEDKRGNSEGKK